jgi:hypothetical protein
MRYPFFDQQAARNYLIRKKAGGDPGKAEFVKFKGEGEDFPIFSFVALREKLDMLRRQYPEKLSARSPQGGKFEAEAFPFVHEYIKGDLEMHGDPDFWVYVSLGEFADLIEWRYAAEENESALANYGIGNRFESFFYRLWMRGDIGYEPKKTDKYVLAKRGDMDFWRSHVHRQRYGNCRNLARALVSIQYPDETGKPALPTEDIRELAKKLRLIYANLEYSFLDSKQASSLIKMEIDALKDTDSSRTK